MRWIAVLSVCGTIYVLSLGPASYLIIRAGSGQEVGEVIYAPLIWIDDAFNVEALAVYEGYFIKLAMDADK